MSRYSARYLPANAAPILGHELGHRLAGHDVLARGEAIGRDVGDDHHAVLRVEAQPRSTCAFAQTALLTTAAPSAMSSESQAWRESDMARR